MNHPNRKNLRLSQNNYTAPGGYFVTVCTANKKCTLSRIMPGDEFNRAAVQLTALGRFAKDVLLSMEPRYGITVDAYVIMPNHIHIIITTNKHDPGITLGQIIGAYKSLVAKQWRDYCNHLGLSAGSIWQRNYYDHVLRNEADYLEKMKYIDENPDKWCLDDEYIPGD